jgi:hypothetical protein
MSSQATGSPAAITALASFGRSNTPSVAIVAVSPAVAVLLAKPNKA